MITQASYYLSCLYFNLVQKIFCLRINSTGKGKVLPDKNTHLITEIIEYIRLDYSLPGSPHGQKSPQSQKSGDVHNWSMWAEKKSYKIIAEDNCRFISEFGRQSVPCLDALKKFIPEDKLWPPDKEIWAYHSGSLDGFDNKANEKLESCIKEFGVAHNLEEYILLTQLAQAETYKLGLEHFRRRKYECGGCLFWKFADTWPSVSCSVVDYYLKPKMVYYYLRKACSPVLVSFKEEEEGVSVWIVNDGYEPLQANLKLCLQDFEGEYPDVGGRKCSHTFRLQYNDKKVLL